MIGRIAYWLLVLAKERKSFVKVNYIELESDRLSLFTLISSFKTKFEIKPIAVTLSVGIRS